MWSDTAWEIEIQHVHRQFIHLSVLHEDCVRWELTAVYANPHAMGRRGLWEDLNQIIVESPWALIGDFNCVLKDDERNSDSGVSSSFVEWVERKGLIDLGYSGQRFTWQHGTNVSTRKATRLDRALCNVEWSRRFHSANIKHLPHAYSDQCPLLLSLDIGDEDRLGDRPFRFLASWLRHEDFES